jgi:hypothetical protein
MIAATSVRCAGHSRANQSVCKAYSSISLHRLGTFGKLRVTVPVLSLTAMIRSMGTLFRRSTCPLDQVISRELILVRFPTPK